MPRWPQVNILSNMAEMVCRRVEESWALARRQQEQQQRQFLNGPRGLAAYATPIMFIDTDAEPWLITYCNAAAAKLAGAQPGRIPCMGCFRWGAHGAVGPSHSLCCVVPCRAVLCRVVSCRVMLLVCLCRHKIMRCCGSIRHRLVVPGHAR